MYKSKSIYNYYEVQLERLKPEPAYYQSIKIFDGVGGSTNTLDLNEESIPIIIEFLNKELQKIQDLKQLTSGALDGRS